jgi:ATP-dependent DNA helicase RecG
MKGGMKTTRKPQENHEETTRTPQEIRGLILASLKSDPTISLQNMSKQTGLSYASLRHHIEKMREDGLLRREGADKGGKWVVIEKS